MPKLIDRVDTQRFFALFVGRHHSGKTVAEASFPKPLHFEDFDGRIGGAQVPFLDLSGITYDYWPPKSPDLIGRLNKKLEVMQAQGQLSMGQISDLPKTHVTDSITNECYAFICQALPLTHMRKDEGQSGAGRKSGRWIGPIQMAGPEDYGLEAQATYDYIAFMKSLPIPNVIISAHNIEVYDFQKDEDGEPLPYAPKVVVGEKLSIRDKIGENIQTSFDHIFRFEKRYDGVTRKDKYFVRFRGGIACTTYSWLPDGDVEWTGKNFYGMLMDYKKKSEEKANGNSTNKS